MNVKWLWLLAGIAVAWFIIPAILGVMGRRKTA